MPDSVQIESRSIPQSEAFIPTSVTSRNRAYALDALRGIAILAMLLSGQLPFGKNSLPAWMYHAQEPPPTHAVNLSLPGITWVDLVFPFFLFSMGAAFPLAFGRRMEQGKVKVAWSIFERGFLLGFFGLYVQAIRPYVLSHQPTMITWLVALLGFALLFPMYMRLPASWSQQMRWGVKIAGWIGGVTFLALARYPDGTGFQTSRSDIIIIVLANMAIFGSAIWVLTRTNLLLRLGVLGVLMAIRLSNMPQPVEGWVSEIWKWSPIPWFYKLYYLQYLFIVIPGTIAGDLIVRWIHHSKEPARGETPAANSWSTAHLAAVSLLMFSLVLAALIGLEARWVVSTTVISFIMCGLGWWLLRKPGNETERLFKSMFGWAIYWLVLGYFLEPYEEGIKKSRATMSYYFITSGLAVCMLIGLMIVTDVFKKRRWLQLFIDNGQNPMIAYAGINNFIIPVLALTTLNQWLSNFVNSPWRGFLKGSLITLLMAVTVSFLTRRKIFWRT